MESETLMILSEDNSVEVHYTDGSKLLLSPCGSEFLFEKATPASAHPIQPPERIRQRTPFAISLYREQLLRALDFRNLYSNHPYLPSRIIPSERKDVYFTDIDEAKWPSPHDTEEMIRVQNGDVTVSSLDDHACLFLPERQEEFTVQFLCKVSQTLPALLPFSDKSCDKSVQECYGGCSKSSLSKLSSKQLRSEDGGRHLKQENKSSHVQKNEISTPFETCSSEYSWVTQQMSVSSCPAEWKYPLLLALKFYRSHPNHAAESDKGNKGSDSVGLDVSECEMSLAVTRLPLALPLSCQAPYLHRWDFSNSFKSKHEDGGRYLHSQPVKVLWTNGVIYRFFPGTKSIEIYPGDGSVFKSEGSFLGKYFIRYYIQEQTKERRETMYSVSNLPPDIPGSNYSVCAIITQALRVLQHDLENILSLTHNYSISCWQMAHGEELLPAPLAENIIPNVGRVFAYSDNKVHAIFNDGMTLNMVWDFSSCHGKSQRFQNVNAGWCKLMFPEGEQQLVQIDCPGIYERYITTVVEWCKSLNKNRETYTVASQPIPELEENWSVAAELEKIKRFNFLMENSNIPHMVTTVKRNPSFNIVKGYSPEKMFSLEDVGEKNIAETLEKTSKVINDIDSLLASSTNQNMLKGTSSNTFLQ